MSNSVKNLTPAILSTLDEGITIPQYDRSKIQSGIVHIGVGGFHRAHQAYYLNQLFNKNKAFEWGIVGVGLMDRDREMYEALNGQQGLYTLVTQHPDGEVNSEIIGSIQKMYLATETPNEVIELLARKLTKIISLTITEGGYNFNPNTGEFILDNPDIKHDLENPKTPKTVFGYLAASFSNRYKSNASGVTVLSCDNVQHNGDMTKKGVLAFAKAQDPKLASWIEDNVTFPNAMVDRITPVTTDETRNFVKDKFGFIDKVPVNCEPFIQWVIEDNFKNGRPPLEDVGAQFVPDVTPYEHMKLRLLNAGHSVVGITGAIHGFDRIDECVQNSVMAKFLRAYLKDEASPMLEPVEGITVANYIDTLIERFGNPNIKDSVSRICTESAAKLPKFLIPTIIENLKKDGPIALGAFVLASWCYYSDKQKSKKGKNLEINDDMKDTLHQHAAKTENNPLAFLEIDEVFGSLKDDERFTKVYKEMIALVYEEEDMLDAIESALAK